jgi:hypothetical protein
MGYVAADPWVNRPQDVLGLLEVREMSGLRDRFESRFSSFGASGSATP